MKKIKTNLSVKEATDKIKNSLEEKGFILFGDVDHQANAKKVDLTMPASRTLIFGNPLQVSRKMTKSYSLEMTVSEIIRKLFQLLTPWKNFRLFLYRIILIKRT